MINTTDDLIFLKKGDRLASALKAAVERLEEQLADLDELSVSKRNDIRYFLCNVLPQVHRVTWLEYLVNHWYQFLEIPDAFERELHGSLFLLDTDLFSTYSKSFLRIAKTPMKLLFVNLYEQGAVLLPHTFRRATGGWVEKSRKSIVDTECLHLFQTMDLSEKPESESARGIRRVYQSALKVLLASTWYCPEDINADELQAWRTWQGLATKCGHSRLPLADIVSLINKSYPGRVSPEVLKWAQNVRISGGRPVNCTELSSVVKDVLRHSSNPLEVVQKILAVTSVGAASFGPSTISEFLIVETMRHEEIDIENSYRVWLEAQNFFFELKSHLEVNKQYRSAIGRLNLYLFIYLPLWLRQHPDSTYSYPDQPNKFTGALHWQCKLPREIVRPLSFTEFLDEVGAVSSYESLSKYRVFFDSLVSFGEDLEGCSGLKSPVKALPKSKKYVSVTKHIFPGEHLLLYVDYLYAINSAAQFLTDDSARLFQLVSDAKQSFKFFCFEDIGYVPIVYWNGRVVPILQVDPGIFSFLGFELEHIYNPGSTRFSLFMLEVGTRGQTVQWLDADSYDCVSDRISSHPLQLTSLWLNTDKISSVPLIVVTIMQALWLLDEQRAWRNSMIEYGVEAFGNPVKYEDREHSKWGSILPLFAADARTGLPFTDSAYAAFWTAQCFSFQNWLSMNGIAHTRLVALLPKRIGEKRYFTWEDFVKGIKPSEVVVEEVTVDPSQWGQAKYIGQFCPVVLRSKITPHGARASFVTSMSTVLSPEAVGLLTQQKASTIRRYNKGGHLLRQSIQGAFNHRDAKLCLVSPFQGDWTIPQIADAIEGARGNPNFLDQLSQWGLISTSVQNSSIKMNGLQLIATDAASKIGAEFTHMCALNFHCSSEVITEFGERNCPECPYGIWSPCNIGAVSAKRQQLGEEYERASEIVTSYIENKKMSARELGVYQEKLNKMARKLAGWMVVEESLWAMILHWKKDPSAIPQYMVKDVQLVLNQVQRFEVKPNSPEEFFMRVGEACLYEQSISEELRVKVDRAIRLLLVRNGNAMEAALMPTDFNCCTRLAGIIRSDPSFDSLNIDEFVKLVNMPSEEWNDALVGSKVGRASLGSDFLPVGKG